MKIHQAERGIQFWYDPHTRCWWAARFDEQGQQVGQAVDAYSRREIMLVVRQLASA